MDSRKDTTRKATTEPKKVKKDESVELQVEELEERVAPMKMNL